MKTSVSAAFVALLGMLTLSACGAPPTVPTPMPSVAPAMRATAPPPVTDDIIMSPGSWELVAGDTLVQSHSGSEPVELKVATDEVGAVYAMCAAGVTLSIDGLSVHNDKEQAFSTWDVPCEGFPSRRTTYTDASTVTSSLRLSVEGEGAWGFVLAHTAEP